MVKKIHSRLGAAAGYLVRFRKNFFLLAFCFFNCLSFTAVGTEETPEVIESIRASLSTKFKEPKKKAVVAKSVGVESNTLKRFIGCDTSIRPSTIKKIIENFKANYKEEYDYLTASASPVSISSKPMDSTQSSQPGLVNSYSCLNLSALPFHTSYPDTYSLLMVDSSLIPRTTLTDWDQHREFKNLGRLFLRECLATDENISFATTEQEIQGQRQWILKDEKEILTPGEEKKPYYILQLFKKREELRTVALVKALTERHIGPYNGFDFQAALIIFPYPQQKAMVYGLGKWNSLLNPDCIVPQWGLRLVTSGQICNPNKIKGFYADHYRTSNPYSKREKAADTQPIEAFGLEVGSEELKMITLMPNKSVKTRHVIEGTDHLKFTINPSDEATFEQTLQSLNKIAMYFFTLASDCNFHIHNRMREFIDDEIRERDLIEALNEKLQGLFKSPKGKEFIFPHQILWREMKSKKLQFGESKIHSIFDVFAQLTPEASFPKTIQVWKPRLKTPKEFIIWQIFYSLPLEHEENFYRFDRGHWYQVDSSRFEGIKRILRQIKRPSASLHLPDYSLEGNQQQEQGGYKEAKYNFRAVQEVNKNPGWKAILLDRINVSLGEAGSKFEFADLLIKHMNTFYIVHVKRDSVSKLSHHREQVERSVDFLATELTKKSAHTLFLQGIINGLYEKNGLPIKKEKKQGTRITKGDVFLKHHASLNGSQDFLLDLPEIKSENPEFPKFLQHVLQFKDKKSFEFLKNYPFELASVLDALFDCVSHKKAYLLEMEVEEFLNAVEQGIKARQLLFPQGPLKKSDLKKVKVVLAVINDHSIEASLKEKTQASQRIIFKNQDLWGLDRTRTVVEKAGLGFELIVINEDLTEIRDAFGPIIKKERKENFISESGDEPRAFARNFVWSDF